MFNNFFGIPANKLEFFLQGARVASYIPGRVRLYHKALMQNPQRAKETEDNLLSYSEINSVKINISTGSLLIEYDPDILRKNPELRKAELYIMEHVSPKR